MSALRPSRGSAAATAAGAALALAWFALAADARVVDPLVGALVIGAVAANALSVRYDRSLWVSASFTCSIVAVAVLGPAAAFVIAALGEAGAWLFDRIRPYAVAGNVLAAGIPNLVAGTLFVALVPASGEPLPAALALLPAAALALTLSYAIASTLSAPTLREGLRAARRPPSPLVPALGWAVVVAIGVAQLYEHVPAAGAAALVLLLLGVVYMLQLVAASRQHRARAGVDEQRVVEELLCALRDRDPESARHAAGVARFSRSIAEAAGLPEPERGAAHIAGLLHDPGRLSLSDIAPGAEGSLTEHEWAAIRRHPEAGAAMARSLGLSELVVDAIAAHHERPDGRGYPNGLTADEIPVLAKVVAVAEVYDTLTAGTYRPQVSSFQALSELRRVSGTQLDERFVEALADVIAHRPVDERLAVGADVDAELAFGRTFADPATT